MTLFVLEGCSKSGKSTVRDILLEDNPEWIRWKGENLMRKGFGDDWLDYQRRYHESLHRLYELNPENTIIADRAFTDAVYNSDARMREEFKRLYACYGNVYILYFVPAAIGGERDEEGDEDIGKAAMRLKERNSRDGHRVNEILDRYDDLLSMFPHQIIDTHNYSRETSAEHAEAYINSVNAVDEHSPDI